MDVDRAAKYGLKPGDVRRATSAIVGGITVGALFEEQKVFDVVVWGRPEMRGNVDDVRNLMIHSEEGNRFVWLRSRTSVSFRPAASSGAKAHHAASTFRRQWMNGRLVM